VSGSPATRLVAVDVVRGAVMVVMALDHVRDFFSDARFDPTDLARATPALFLTRWVTHFCAPLFVLLAGTSAWLHGARGLAPRELARFLLLRGLWLVALEVTVVRLGWTFNFDYSLIIGQVIWAIGWSMVALAGLVFLPVPAVAAVGLALVAGHNLLDGVGSGSGIWMVLHVPGRVAITPGMTLFVAYPLLPWIGVMAAGYALGPWLARPRAERRRGLLALGLASTLAFVVLRATSLYGDPRPWTGGGVLAFLNTTKYPPSLQFLLMTIGPGLLLLGLADREAGPAAGLLATFGRVPLFYYVLHLYLIHALAVAATLAVGGPVDALFSTLFMIGGPPGYGWSLGVVYAVWLGVVLALLPPCRWFADVKRRRSDPWLSYL
jgi:uncharacterized membrane protein